MSRNIRILLAENIHPLAKLKLVNEGFTVQSVNRALSTYDLENMLPQFDVVGIRSATEIDSEIIESNPHLMAIGCFCIGTNQVDITACQRSGIPVFNSPYANSRSVAELIIGQIIALSRQLGDRNREVHTGVWNKTAKDCHEIRGKVLGIVGYGHIGSQLSVLAENIGMQVIYYDIVKKLAHGNTQVQHSLDALLSKADFVTLHVPATDGTHNMIGRNEITKMKPGSYLLNASRGNVVVLEDLFDALERRHLAGAYLDVYPEEPPKPEMVDQIKNLRNLILTPHIGGSTEEAQASIADEVSDRFIGYLKMGDTQGAVNFPATSPPDHRSNDLASSHRILNIHHNVPGVLRDLNTALAGYNVSQQYLITSGEIGYVIIDVDSNLGDEVFGIIAGLKHSIKTRILD